MKSTGSLFYVPLGWHEDVFPRPGETVDALYKRLKRLARDYSYKWDRHFRVEQKSDSVLWWRVDAGQQSKLARWYRVAEGEEFVVVSSADEKDLKKVKATARYLMGKGIGNFDVRLEHRELIVRRSSTTVALVSVKKSHF